LAWSGDGSELATASTQSDEIHIWNIKEKKITKIIKFPVPPAMGAFIHYLGVLMENTWPVACHHHPENLFICKYGMHTLGI
jgi:WD40 repeat protein